MPASFVLDEVFSGAELDLSLDGISRRIRTGRVKGLTVNGSQTVPDPRVLEKVLSISGFPQLGDGYPAAAGIDEGPNIEGLKLKRQIIRPKSYNSMGVVLIYETEDNQFNPGSYLIREDTRTFTETTNMLPGTRIPIRVNWVNAADASEFIPEDYLVIHYDRPIRALQILATIYGDPPTIQREMVGTVNDNTWLGYPVGYWKVDSYSTESRDRGSSWQVSASVSSKKNEDWSVYGILQNKHTGQFVEVSDTQIGLLVAQPYIYGQYVVPNKGCVKVGPYTVSPFDLLFGFSSF